METEMAGEMIQNSIEEDYMWVDSYDSWELIDPPVHEIASLDLNSDDASDVSDGYMSEILPLVAKSFRKRPFLCIGPVNRMGIQDIVKEHVLPFLPAKSLYRFRNVCKEWDKWITSPFFAHKQSWVFQQISGVFFQEPYGESFFAGLDHCAHGVPNPSLGFLPDQVHILSTRNGLLCCRGEESYYVCNPVTRKWERLPRPNFHHGPETAVVLALDTDIFNFNANFQIVCMIPQPDSEFVIFEIYSSRSCSWRHHVDVCPELMSARLIGNGLYRKGYVYWMVDSGVMLVFDLLNEQYGTMKLPDGCGPCCALSEFNGELCYIEPRMMLGDPVVQIYRRIDMSLKDVVFLQVGHLRVGEGGFRALGFANDDVLLITLGTKLIAYQMREERAQVLDSWVPRGNGVRYLPYVNSLVTVCRLPPPDAA